MKKHFFGAAVAAVLAFGGISAPAQAATVDEGSTYASLTAFWNSISSNWWTYAGNTYTGTYSDVKTTTFYGSYASVVTTVYDWTLSIASTGTTATADGTAVATSATGYIAYAGLKIPTSEGPASFSTAAAETVTGFYSGPMAVPGPIAGAGLPVLLVLGGAAALRRRKAAA